MSLADIYTFFLEREISRFYLPDWTLLFTMVSIFRLSFSSFSMVRPIISSFSFWFSTFILQVASILRRVQNEPPQKDELHKRMEKRIWFIEIFFCEYFLVSPARFGAARDDEMRFEKRTIVFLVVKGKCLLDKHNHKSNTSAPPVLSLFSCYS